MSQRMAGKAAIITGGGGGIGGATGELFCAEGGRVLLVDRNLEALNETARRVTDRVAGAAVDVFQGDVSVFDDSVAAVNRAVTQFGGLDVLVNCAAIRNIARVETTEHQVWTDLLGVNLLGAVNFCKAAVPALRSSGKAAVVNVSSVYGVMGRANWAIYDATKAALLALTRTFAIEEAPKGIRVNAICVGGTLTPFTIGRAKTRGVSESDLRREGREENLLKRWGEPIESAYPILWLASDEASFITGATLMVDGGRSVL